jgi:hypothetical protein
VTWEVYLSASPTLLDELPKRFRTDELSFRREGNQLVIRSQELDGLTDIDIVRAHSDRLTDALSGISRLLVGSDSAMALDSIAQVRADGSKNVFLHLEPAVIRLGDLHSTGGQARAICRTQQHQVQVIVFAFAQRLDCSGEAHDVEIKGIDLPTLSHLRRR